LGEKNDLSQEPSINLVTLSFNMLLMLLPDPNELANALISGGYSLIDVPRRGKLAMMGDVIARKKDIIVTLNQQRRVLGIDVQSSKAALEGFQELLGLLIDTVNINVEKNTLFFELLGKIHIKTKLDPLESMSKAFSSLKLLQEFNIILGEEVSPVMVQFMPKSKIPSDKDYFDITIRPILTSPRSKYLINVVYRSPDYTKVLTFLDGMENNLLKFIEIIEAA